MSRWKCDGWDDCLDGSNIQCAYIHSHANGFKCKNQQCIRNYALYNGINDCDEGFRHRNSRSRSGVRSPAFRHDERSGPGEGGGEGGGDPDLYHNLINEDYRDDERNYNPRNNINTRQFRREDNFEQNSNHRNNSRDNDRGRDLIVY